MGTYVTNRALSSLKSVSHVYAGSEGLRMADSRTWVIDLYDRYKNQLYRHALFVLGHPADAEDAVAEVFLKVVKSPSTFRDHPNVQAWIWTILRNQMIDMLRARRRKPTVSWDAVQFDSIASTRNFDWLEWKEVLMCLKPSERQVVSLRLVQGFSSSETAHILGCSDGKVRMMLSRVRKRLQLESGAPSTADTGIEGGEVK